MKWKLRQEVTSKRRLNFMEVEMFKKLKRFFVNKQEADTVESPPVETIVKNSIETIPVTDITADHFDGLKHRVMFKILKSVDLSLADSTVEATVEAIDYVANTIHYKVKFDVGDVGHIVSMMRYIGNCKIYMSLSLTQSCKEGDAINTGRLELEVPYEDFSLVSNNYASVLKNEDGTFNPNVWFLYFFDKVEEKHTEALKSKEEDQLRKIERQFDSGKCIHE